MTGVLVEIRHNKRAAQRSLRLDSTTQAAVAELFRERWPSNTAKLAARAFNLSVDQGRSAVAGRASQSTIDQIIKAGGWPVLFALGAKVLSQGADQYLIELRASHEQERERVTALLGGWWPMAADRRSDPSHPDPALGERRRSFRDRRAEDAR